MVDRTIFCLGARGHYENATSDLLKFFLDHRNEHALGKLFFHCLLECAKINVDFGDIKAIYREKELDEDKRIDLLIEGEQACLVIENKHWSSLGNPLSLYENYGNRYAADFAHGCSFILLGFESPPNFADSFPNWHFVTYRDFLNALGTQLSSEETRTSQDARWRILTDEFMHHLRFESRMYEARDIDNFLSVLRNEAGQIEERRIDEAAAKLKLYVSSRLLETFDKNQIKLSTWDDASDKGHGWLGGEALSFGVERKSAPAIASLAIRICKFATYEDNLPQLVLIVWVRRFEGASSCRNYLVEQGFTEIGCPNIRYWDSSDGATAHQYVVQNGKGTNLLMEGLEKLKHVALKINQLLDARAPRRSQTILESAQV